MSAQQIRQHFRKARASLTLQQQEQHAILLHNNLNDFLGFLHNRKIAAYLATQAEISLNPWIAGNPRQQIFLPMLYEPIEPRLRFAPLDKHTRWKHNRFKILEPDTHWGNTLHAHQLDYIFTPLVAFDRQGNRMGMGGGFYDRSLSFRTSRKQWLKPKLIGIAHSCQEYDALPFNPWDVTMDWVITEKEIIRAKN